MLIDGIYLFADGSHSTTQLNFRTLILLNGRLQLEKPLGESPTESKTPNASSWRFAQSSIVKFAVAGTAAAALPDTLNLLEIAMLLLGEDLLVYV